MSAVREANTFLAPVFEKGTAFPPASGKLTERSFAEQLVSFTELSLVLRLAKSLTTSTDRKAIAPLVIRHALDLLLRIHKEIRVRDLEPVASRLENPGERRTIFALLDLVVLEGIYPSLSPGVGIPIERRARSFVLPQQLSAPVQVQEVNQHRNIELLASVVYGLIGVFGAQDGDAHGIWKSPKAYQGIEGMVRERCLVDLIAGCGELALNTEHEGPEQPAWRERFSGLIEGSVPPPQS